MMKIGRLACHAIIAIAAAAAIATADHRAVLHAQDCARRLVAGGDHYPSGHEIQESERYPNHLLEDHLKKWGSWCDYDIAKEGTTSSTYITGGQLAQTWNLRPDLITLTVGEENTTIIKLVTDCFDNIKDHDFSAATTCAAAHPRELESLVEPELEPDHHPAAVPGDHGRPAEAGGRDHRLSEPVPEVHRCVDQDRGACAPRSSTPSRRVWRAGRMLPPALDTIDQVFQKLNKTIENAVKPFAIGSNGRFVYVNTYTKTARPLHEDGSRDQDEGRAPGGRRGRPRPQLTQGELRLFGSLVQGGRRRDCDPVLPGSGHPRRSDRSEPDDVRDGRPSERRR